MEIDIDKVKEWLDDIVLVEYSMRSTGKTTLNDIKEMFAKERNGVTEDV